MKRGLSISFALILLIFPSLAGNSTPERVLPRLKLDIAVIIDGLLSCYERGSEPRFLEMALRLSEIKTHPLFELEWGRHPGNATGEQQLLLASARLRALFRGGNCPPGESERRLCRLAQEYIRANDRPAASAGMAALDFSAASILGQLQKSLSPSQLLLKYVMLGDRVLLYFIGSGHAGFEFLAVGRAQLDAMVRQLCEPLEDFASGKVDYLRIHFDMALANRLHNVLLESVSERFPHADELLVIPDESLYTLPFEALVTDFNNRHGQDDALFSEYQAAEYVIQGYKVSYFFSLSDFLRRFQIRGDYPLALAAFGHPLMPPSGQREALKAIADIPSTRLEVLNLEMLFSGQPRRIFMGADFNWENFSRFAPQAKLIHLATHFFGDGKDPSRSSFLFSASGRATVFCEARHVSDLRLQAELMILSACETSEKNLLGFRLLSGMTAAIRRAGVRNLIASLWPVDEFSSQIVPLFYRDFLGCGDSAAALRHSKLVLLNRTISLRGGMRMSLAHPFLWANYVLYRFCR